MNIALNLPSFEIKTRQQSGQSEVFDIVRMKYVSLTPEEWVRQHFVNYLLVYKGYPKSLLTVEHPVIFNNLQQRADIVSFNRQGKPVLVVECKSPSVELTREVYAQAARYNLTLKANHLVVTNGINHFCSRIDLDSKEFFPLTEVPNFQDIANG